MNERVSDFVIELHPEAVVLERADFQIRLAGKASSHERSDVLIQRMYTWRGYEVNTHESGRLGEQITFQACCGEQVFGTVTLCLDSAWGLPADELYRPEIDAYRVASAKVCELIRLAVDPVYGSKEVFGALFHLAYICGGLIRGVTDVFIEVNPRHVSFYQRMLHFTVIGSCKLCERVKAPAVLLHLSVAHVKEQIARHGGGAACASRSLYPFFLSSSEQARLHDLMASSACGPAV